MSRQLKFKPKRYKHQEIIDKFDDFMIAVKCNSLKSRDGLTSLQITKLKKTYPMPSTDEMDMLHLKIREVLSEDHELLIKR